MHRGPAHAVVHRDVAHRPVRRGRCRANLHPQPAGQPGLRAQLGARLSARAALTQLFGADQPAFADLDPQRQQTVRQILDPRHRAVLDSAGDYPAGRARIPGVDAFHKPSNDQATPLKDEEPVNLGQTRVDVFISR